ncbi:TPR repeat protein [Parabacteroides sp. PF5-5]|uniref:tetratricopeptide repeat protein n=1 Tax=unclassified Parabacteroides TaxID=2649774 RepID=UPI0024766E32|nr:MULTISPECIES: SEL1-like repeat protein [unclassified Parabacteroides]MDH6306367.1 TPR repeat protein [Parabacteroides sp. PH5-39]MDH6314639.1 TPR repeat protein [Parabacteroides sp. PF5-13]MDH6321078.1 TPR repeat protein [Parabacteroides sp. PH5-13]MDH6324810.1 TPR repeat protein [Parabacteroides sp. PH5-8]MDH6325509.1 TPR repeat protein [Parabacteroides sp. PH5-41]
MKIKIFLLLYVFLFFCAYTHAQEYEMVKVRSSIKDLDIRFESCIKEGNLTLITYYIKNNIGQPIKMVNIGSREDFFDDNDPACKTNIVDNIGNSYIMRSLTLGTESSIPDSDSYPARMTIDLPTDVWLKGTIGILTHASAKSFQNVNIGFLLRLEKGFYGFCYTFQNVPIYTKADLLRIKQEKLIKETQDIKIKAEQGDAKAQYELGKRYYDGIGISHNSDLAFEWYRKSAEQNFADAQSMIGVYYCQKEEYDEAIKWFEKSIIQGSSEGLCNMGLMYYSGIGVQKDIQKAYDHFYKSAQQGNVDAKVMIGEIFYYGHLGSQDYQKAFTLYTQAASEDNASAQNKLGLMYYFGRGVTANYETAAEWFEKSVRQGEGSSKYYLGYMYLKGLGVNKNISKGIELLNESAQQGYSHANVVLGDYYIETNDYSKSLSYYQQAADQSDAEAILNLAYMHKNGLGVLKNPQKAIEFFEKSANLGNADAQYQLALIYKEANNLTKALPWFEKSAGNANADAQYELGLMYYYGKGTTKNNKKSAEWIEKSYSSGHKEAEKIWNSLELWKYK